MGRIGQPIACTTRGLSMVELLVGLALGLLIVAAAGQLLAAQATEHRQRVAQAQLQQDLRAALDLVARELRRSGSLGPDATLARHVAAPEGRAATPRANRHAAVLEPAVATGPDATTDNLRLAYRADAEGPAADQAAGGSHADDAASGTTPDTARFRLNRDRGVLEARLGEGHWQALTDPATTRVTHFAVTRRPDAHRPLPCAKPCPDDGGTACWPAVVARQFELQLTAASRQRPAVVHTLRTRVTLRNELLAVFEPAAGHTPPAIAALSPVCPA